MLIQNIELTNSMPLQYAKSSDIGNNVANVILNNEIHFFYFKFYKC